ncbi:cache domain-containing protein [uncultured Cocleimonas sp.]|uniref:sensor histidine kinase n=1 Tax=uncultured Cocleimonas sp. TaxID=1051587 RepID=UPI0026171251|nr:cache domain-containing protein [uncultured Cocleimonas sp.]
MSFIGNMRRAVRHKVRYKLLLLVLFPILLIMPVALGLAIYWGKNFTYEQLFLKVNTDLAVSHDAFNRIQDDYLNHLTSLAESHQFRTALESGNNSSVIEQVNNLKNKLKFSFLKVISTENDQHNILASRRNSSTLLNALKGHESVGVEIYSPEELLVEDAELHKRVQLPILQTPRARPSNRTHEGRAMVIRALYPVKDSRGEVVALLDGGVLLNGNFEFVDAIRDLAYGPDSLPEGSIGTVTVFIDDVRISTNVPLKKGERALGTRVSNEVRTKVLDNGSTWIDRAFVVNDWYVSSYEPIIDVDGNRVGMLYAGFLEKPFRDELWNALLALVLMFLTLMLVSAWAAIRGARRIFKPIEKMSAVVHATQEGGATRVGLIASKDELGTLSREFDDMLDQLQLRNQEIQEWADSLEDKVESRTAELKQKNQDLENSIQLLRKTRQQLVVAEKLAALGELTAGVAHEINNPTAVMLGNLDIMVAELGDNAAPVQKEIDLVIDQIYRIKDIINRLLQYAHPEEYSGYINMVEVNSLIKDTLKLVNHLSQGKSIEFKMDLRATEVVEINPQELQQVLVNLLVNAIHALDRNDAEINLKSRNWKDKGVVISVSDNGKGIDKEHLEQIFNPFFSTKQQGEGTGLGLSISYGLVRRYGGNITAESEVGEGSTFSVWLLSEPQIMDDEEAIAEQLSIIEEAAI